MITVQIKHVETGSYLKQPLNKSIFPQTYRRWRLLFGLIELVCVSAWSPRVAAAAAAAAAARRISVRAASA